MLNEDAEKDAAYPLAEDNHYLCTLRPDHEGRHKAWADRGDKGHDGREGGYIAHEWENEK